MNHRYLYSLGFAVAVAIGGIATGIDSQPAIALKRTVSEPVIVAQAPEPSATWTGVDHPTSGMARVVTDNGQRYLEFDEAFKTDNGPDLFVLLHTDAVPQSYTSDNYVNLGRLEQVAGEQRYLIPDDVQLDDYSSAVIWCRQFDVTFGYATFS